MKLSLLMKGRILISCAIATTLVGAFVMLQQSGFADSVKIGTSKEYMAPELFVEYGDYDFDIKKNVEYDSDKYILDIVDADEYYAHLGQEPGTYSVGYRLRVKQGPTYLERIEEFQSIIDNSTDVATTGVNTEESDIVRDDIDNITEETEAVEETEAGTETEVETEDGSETETGSETEAVEETGTEAGSETEVETEAGSETEVETEAGSETETETALEADGELQAIVQDFLKLEDVELADYLKYLDDVTARNYVDDVDGNVYFYRDITIASPVRHEELFIAVDSEEYDLLEGIEYDSEKYSLAITNEDTFDINNLMSYAITYKLQGEGDLSYTFLRFVTVIDEEQMETHNELINKNTKTVPIQSLSSVISRPDTYSLDMSLWNNTLAYLTVSAKNATIHLKGTGTIGGIKLTSSNQTLVIWVESGADVEFKSGAGNTAAIHSSSATNQVFIVGEGELTLTGAAGVTGSAGGVGTLNGAGNSVNNAAAPGGSGGTGAMPAVHNTLSLSVYSNNRNIEVIGGNSGNGGQGGRALYYSNGGTGGGGAGGGGYPAIAVGAQSSGGSSGSSGYFSYNNEGTSETYGNAGGAGGAGALGGGGGVGTTFTDTNSVNYGGTGGYTGSVTSASEDGIIVKSGYNGTTGGNWVSPTSKKIYTWGAPVVAEDQAVQ